MSLIIQKLIPIPEEVEVSLNKKLLTIKGVKGINSHNFDHILMTMDIHENNIRLRLWNPDRKTRAKLLTAASKIESMIKGVTNGFKYKLRAVYKHFPISFDISEDKKILTVTNFLGQKNKQNFTMMGNSTVEMDIERDTISISGSSLEDVSQTAGHIQNTFKPRKFDFRVFLDGIYISAKGMIEEH